MTSPALPGWSAATADLPARFLDRRRPTPVPDPYLVAWNPAMAADLGLGVDPGDLVATLSGNLLPEGIAPHAAGYAGHQFGIWVPELGDGRAITIGALPGRDRVLREIQLKGSGMTRWSRMGDGRAVLRSTVREYLASAAMAGLGIPTTGALAITGSDLPVYRERTETAAILTRVSPTFIRFGTFQWLASLGEREAIRPLADSVIERFFPALLALPADERHGAWYAEVVARTARLMAAWIAVGFAHGVMNTDNFSIIGETIDYGPFGWMDRYQPGLVCNHSDWQGRYAFDQQPMVGLWNCSRLGEALYPLVSESAAVAALERYHPVYEAEVIRRMRDKLGLITVDGTDADLISDFLDLMQATGADYHRSFRALSRWDADLAASREAVVAAIPDGGRLDAWLARYAARLASEPRPATQRHAAMLGSNPKYVLRNWVAQDAIENAETRNFAAVDAVRTLLDDPFAEHPTFERFAAGPPAWAREIVVSCSS